MQKSQFENLTFSQMTFMEISKLLFPKHIVLISLKIYFVSESIADPDEMQHIAAFHLGLHCFTKYPVSKWLSHMDGRGRAKHQGYPPT